MMRLERYLGCLLGLAVGDALGAPLEGRAPGTFRPVEGMVGGGRFALEAGEWTDDTAMALCLAESLVEAGGFDPVDQLRRYVRWYRDGHRSSVGPGFGIGETTRAALERFEASGETAPYCGSERDRAGNGSLMRLAPVAMAYAADPVAAVERSADSSRTTHAAAEAVDACRYLGALLARALDGAAKLELVATRAEPAPGYWEARPLVATVDEVARGSFRERRPPAIRGAPHAVRTLEAALWAFERSSDFREGCLLAANLGEDADTTAAVYGQLAGAHYGVGGIPEEWLERLALRGEIDALARRLYALAEGGAALMGPRPLRDR